MQYVRTLSLYSVLGLTAVAIGSCDKRIPRENVVPVRIDSPPPPTTGDASVFVPSQPDAGAGDADLELEADAAPEAPESRCAQVPERTGPVTRAVLLESVAACATLQYCELEALAVTFADKAQAYADEQTTERLLATRDAWYFLMQRVQAAELFRFGPAAQRPNPGAQGLRDDIYNWPSTSRCQIEEQLVSKVYETSEFASTSSMGRSLSAAEYLLFETGSVNACPAFRPINSQGTWAALGADELTRRRAGYLGALGRDVLERARRLYAAWDPSRDDFSKQLATAGRGSSVYMTEADAINAIGNALLYVDKELKDLKVARPGGIMDCGADTCPDLRESLYANISGDYVKSNLQGFRLIFQGCRTDFDGVGFDDLLANEGLGDLANDTRAALDGAEAAANTLRPSFDQALMSDKSQIVTLHGAIKKLTDLLKADFAAELDIEPPMGVPTDND